MLQTGLLKQFQLYAREAQETRAWPAQETEGEERGREEEEGEEEEEEER
jgi:hypothetical protein